MAEVANFQRTSGTRSFAWMRESHPDSPVLFKRRMCVHIGHVKTFGSN